LPGSGELGTYTVDDIALSYWLPLAPVEGAQFAPIRDAIDDAVNWAVGQVLGPAGDIIVNALSSFASQVWAVVTGTIGWILKQAYLFERAVLIGWVEPGEQSKFPQASNIFGSDPIYLTQLMASLLFHSVKGVSWSIGRWVASAVSSALGYGKEFGSTLARWAWDIIDWYAHWVFDQTKAVLGFGRAFVDSLPDWIVRHLWGWGDWLLGQIKAGLGFVVDLGGKVVNPLTSVVNSAADWLWRQVSGLVSGIPGAIGALPGAVGKLVTDSASWLWGLISAAVSAIPGAIGALPGALGKLITASADWLWRQISAAVGGIPGALASLPGALGKLVTDSASWLWGLIEPKLAAIASAVVSGAAEVLSGLADIIKDAFTWVFQNAFKPFVGFFAQKLAIPGRALAGDFPTFDSFMQALMDPPDDVMSGFQFFVFALLVGPLSLMVALLPAFAPVNQKWMQEINANVLPSQPPPGVLLTMFRRGDLSEAEFRESLAKQGFNASFVNAYVDLKAVVPSVSDLIRMGVREAFTPEIAERFGQYQDLPPALVEWADKVGLNEEWAARFWASHWDLPSTQQALSMFHRGIISEADLQLFLRSADVMPFWRDKITAISYNPITRVDVRRMYQAGVIDLAKAEQTYRAQGYSPADASALAAWVAAKYPPGGTPDSNQFRDVTVSTIKQAYARRLIQRDEAIERLRELDYSEDDADFEVSIWDFDFFTDPDLRSDAKPKTLGRAVIEKAYRRRLVDANRAAVELEEIGYTPEDAALLLKLQDLDLAEEVSDLEADVVVQLFHAGIITDGELAARLADLDVPQARIELILQRESLKRQVKTARLSQAQLERALKRGVIDEAYYRNRLDALGYNDVDVDLLVALVPAP